MNDKHNKKLKASLSLFLNYMKKAIYFSLLFIIILTVASACGKKLPNNGIPFYIVIDSTMVQADPVTQGSSSSKIDEIWVEMGSQNLGVYELPARIPVLAEPGNYTVSITAGIKNKGISGQRNRYPFYQTENYAVTLGDTQEIKLSPIFKYFDITKFIIKEGFETSNSFISNMTIISDVNVFEGSNSGLMTVAPLSAVETKTNSVLIPTGSVAYIELDYKSNIAFRVGYESVVSGLTQRTTEVTVNGKDTWSKMYIELTPDLSRSQSEVFSFFINTDNGDSTTTGQIYIDNFKVVYY